VRSVKTTQSNQSGTSKQRSRREERESDLSEETNYEMMQKIDYWRLLQREAHSEAIERALRLNEYEWDVEEFLFHEQQVDGVYSYLDKFYDDNFEQLSAYYEACINFMKGGHLPKEIYQKTMKYFYAFGETQFFEKDTAKLSAWANSLQMLEFKLRHNGDFQEMYVKMRATSTEEVVGENERYQNIMANEKIEFD